MSAYSDDKLLISARKAMEADATRAAKQANSRATKARMPATHAPANYYSTKKLSAVPSLHGVLSVRPMDALLELARATPLGGSSAVLERFSRQWAWIRYLGAFDHRNTKLILRASAVANVFDHDRALVSEHMGVAFGVLAAKTWCRSDGASGPIEALPVRSLLNGVIAGHPAGDFDQRGSLEPDYLLSYPDKSPTSRRYRVLECKGTQHASSVAKALGHAVRQVDALRYQGRAIPALATAIVSNEHEISLHSIDPDDEAPTIEVSTENAWSPRGLRRSALSPGMGTEAEGPQWRFELDEFIIARLERHRVAARAALVGDLNVSQAWQRDSWSPVDLSRQLVERSDFGESWLGQEILVRVGGIGARIFVGAHHSVVRALASLELERVLTAEAEFDGTLFERVQGERSDQPDVRPGFESSITSLGPDGVIARIEFMV